MNASMPTENTSFKTKKAIRFGFALTSLGPRINRYTLKGQIAYAERGFRRLVALSGDDW
jgi:hypothetical protein